jgi:hypothetical protein
MTREDLMAAVEAAKAETKEALEIVYNALNNGQKKQLIKHEEVKILFDRYKVEY